MRWRSVQFLGIPEDAFRQILLSGARRYGDVFVNLMAHLAGQTGLKRCGEKTPHHLSHVGDIIKSFPSAKFVCVVFDGRSVVQSRVRHLH